MASALAPGSDEPTLQPTVSLVKRTDRRLWAATREHVHGSQRRTHHLTEAAGCVSTTTETMWKLLSTRRFRSRMAHLHYPSPHELLPDEGIITGTYLGNLVCHGHGLLGGRRRLRH